MIDFIAKLLAAAILLVACAILGIVVYCKVLERPTEIQAEGAVTGKGLGHVKGKTNLKPSFTLELVPNREEGMPIIDIRPDGGGLEGTLDGDGLRRTIGE